MPLLYNFDVERPEELLAILAQNLQKRRLEKGLSREAYYFIGILCGISKSTGLL